MNTTTKRIYSLTAVLIIIAVFLGSFSATVNSDASTITLTIIEANYGDLDFDRIEDDIIVKAVLDSNFEATVLACLYLDIELPSGLIYSFEFQVWLGLDGSQLLLTIKTFDTAIESGWYDCKLTGIIIHNDMMLFSESTYTFDPPTEKGPGEPTALLAVTDYN